MAVVTSGNYEKFIEINRKEVLSYYKSKNRMASNRSDRV